MKKKRVIFVSIIIICLGFIIVNSFLKTPVYLYIADVQYSSKITINVDLGEGHYKFTNYKLSKIEDGVYQLQGYGSLLYGEGYPLKIEIDNSDYYIKTIKQKNLEGTLETVFESESNT